MLILDTINRKLQVLLKTAVATTELACVASWRESGAGVFTPGPTLINTDGTTPVDITPAPGASNQKGVDFLNVFNTDSASADVTLRYNDNGTIFPIATINLAPGERLEFVEGSGLRTFDSGGRLKVVQTTAENVVEDVHTVILGSDVTNNNGVANTIADITGLSFPVLAGQTYRFEFTIPYTSAATTTGSRWSINGPASPTMLAYRSEYTLTATSLTNNSASAYDIPAAASASSLANGNIATIWGIITPSSNGTVIGRFASEVAGSAIVAKAGATLRWSRVL